MRGPPDRARPEAKAAAHFDSPDARRARPDFPAARGPADRRRYHVPAATLIAFARRCASAAEKTSPRRRDATSSVLFPRPSGTARRIVAVLAPRSIARFRSAEGLQALDRDARFVRMARRGGEEYRFNRRLRNVGGTVGLDAAVIAGGFDLGLVGSSDVLIIAG